MGFDLKDILFLGSILKILEFVRNERLFFLVSCIFLYIKNNSGLYSHMLCSLIHFCGTLVKFPSGWNYMDLW